MTGSLGHIKPWWGNEFKELDYKYLPHPDDSMVPAWEQQGYTNMNLNGAVCPLYDTPLEVFQQFHKAFPWANTGIAAYKMNTGDILPVHSDHYMSYRRVFNLLKNETIYRAIVFLEDWKSGHYFEIDSHPITNWKKGDYAFWSGEVPHMAANIGIEPRYTLQVTGMKP
jgi:hypothetical protein